jgi:hypothetical protein
MSESPWTVVSPDGRLAFEIVATRDDGQPALAYRILHDDTEIVEESRLGIEHTSGRLSGVFVAAVSDAVAIQETYHLLHGKQRVVEVDARERIATFCNEAGDEGQLVVRVSNDGAAFRYRVTGTPAGESQLTAELTEFHLGEGHAWIQPHDAATLFTPAYEALYANAIPIGSPEPGPSWNMPALFHTSDRWVLIAESDLVPPAVGMHLSAAADGTYRMVPPEPDEGLGLGDVWPTFDGMWQSPWRVIVVAESLDGIVETTLITDLASPSKIEDTTWITPGRASWSWWSDHDSPQSLPDLYRYADFAAEMGWEHTMVDANWDVHREADIAALAQYARERGIATWLWYNSGGPHNAVTERPRDRMHEAEKRRAEFAKLADWGIAGVKVDFFQSDKPDGIELMWDVLADAADLGIMVNLHGCPVPRGWHRTWPHLMSVEGVRGGEQYAFASEFPETAIWHNTILPYTRNVIGPMDYTPVTISDQLYPHLTSTAHEIALGVLYESGVQHYADSIESYRSLPAEVVDLLTRIPAAWDEIRHVDGFPGTHSVIARRSGDAWYVAGIAGPEAVDVTINPSWLEEKRSGMLLQDRVDAGLDITEIPVIPGTPIGLTIPARGGFVLEIR